LKYSVDNGATYQTSKTFSDLAAGDYTIKVQEQNSSCEEVYGSNPVVIDVQPATPDAPTVDIITITDCDRATGSVTLTGLPETGSWTINPGGITDTGSSDTVTGLTEGIYNYTVTNAHGCTSPESADVDISSNCVAVIDAVVDTTAPVNGLIGGTTRSLTLNDSLDGSMVVIGTDLGNVKLRELIAPAGFTLNTDGTVAIAANTAAANYSLKYEICEIGSPTNCDTVSSTIVVSAAVIQAVVDTTATVNGRLGGINVVNVLANDSLNRTVVNLVQVDLTTVTSNANLILNDDGSIDVPANTPVGIYTLTYKICEKLNPINCNQAEVKVEVSNILPDFTPSIDIDALGFSSEGSTKDFVVNISEIKGAPSDGQVVLKISTGYGFLITYIDTASTSDVNGGVSVNNNDWEITEAPHFITMTLKQGVIIATNTFSAIGFKIIRKPGVPTHTTQPITVAIVNGSGLDNQSNNNGYNIVVRAH
jgi:hypothetical protein